MATLEFEIDVNCECGESLTAKWEAPRHGEPYLSVEVCEKCKDAAYDDGHNDGFKAGEESVDA